MNQHVPDMTIARGSGLGPPPGTVYRGGPQATGSLVAVAPPPQIATARDGRRQRVFGPVPAQSGGMHPLISREKPKKPIDPKEISRTRAALRRAEAEQRAAEAAWVATAPNGGQGDPEKLKAAREALDRSAMLKRTLTELEASASSRPISVVLATVREPAEVSEEIAKGETFYVCLHDGCKGERWRDEASLRRAHPTHQEMQRAQQCHVFAVLCESPLDPLDPDGEIVGYVAPIGRDGTTIAQSVALAEEPETATADEVSGLRAEIAELRAMLTEALTKKK